MAQARRKQSILTLWHHHSLKLHIAVLFMVLIIAACGVIAWSNHVQTRNMVLTAAEGMIDRIDTETGDGLRDLFGPIESLVTWISGTTMTKSGAMEARTTLLPTLADVLRSQPQLDAIFIGYDTGDFFLMRALRNDASRKAFNAPQDAAFLAQSIERAQGDIQARQVIFDAALKPISDEMLVDYKYDPRTRPWYIDAMKTLEVVVTAPYVFMTTREPGLTVARRAHHGAAVVGADVTLRQLSERLKQARPSPSSQLALFDSESGGVLAHSDPARLLKTVSGDKLELARIGAVSPVLAEVAADPGRFIETSRIESGGREWLVKASWVGTGADRIASFAVATPLDELLVRPNAVLRKTTLLALLVIVAAVPLVWWISRRIAGNLRDLTDQAAAIRRFDFSPKELPRTRVNEIFGLGRAMRDLRQTVLKFLDITTALAAERNFERLLQRVLKETHDAAGGKGGLIYLLEDDGRLRPAAQAWEAGDAGDVEALPAIALSDDANPVASAARHTSKAAIHVVPPTRPAGLEFLDAQFGATPVMLVTVPLLNRGGEVVGMLCVFLAGSAEEPSLERLALVEAFAAAGAATIDNQRLLIKQKALLEAFIGLVAGAIDAKSPYTGGHCQRVPELTKMLARAACDVKEGPFAKFDMNEDEWEALHIAGWLHDCGKVTTPEYVVDKATKLETLYDRIHEVRMRFEVLKRDARIACLEAVAAGGDKAKLETALDAELKMLDEEFAFVASSNEGGEFMAPDKIAKLKAIGARTWQRTIDNRLGVSHDEAKRMAQTPAAPLPATEKLLDDKPEHVITRGPQDVMPEGNPWGFKLKTPEYLYNRGELSNLSIARGTLTEEERYKINDHIAQTIVMLTKLPFPKHLKAVPELAGGHHEKMDGTGYPKRLVRDQMSVQARMMAIADIFEALTATDRPYKKGKMLSEAIKIMSFMKRDGHIDPDLFDLFIESGIYRTYAERYMDAKYIDEVDISAYVTRREKPEPTPA